MVEHEGTGDGGSRQAPPAGEGGGGGRRGLPPRNSMVEHEGKGGGGKPRPSAKAGAGAGAGGACPHGRVTTLQIWSRTRVLDSPQFTMYTLTIKYDCFKGALRICTRNMGWFSDW